MVAQPQVSDLGGFEQSFGAAEVEHLVVGAQDGGHDLRVAGQPADGVDTEQVAAQGEPGAAAALLQLVQSDGDNHGGLGVPADAIGGGHRAGDQLEQGVGAAGLGSAQVALPGLGVGQRP